MSSTFEGKRVEASGEMTPAELRVTDTELIGRTADGAQVVLALSTLTLEIRGFDRDILTFADPGDPSKPRLATRDDRILKLLSRAPQARAALEGKLSARRRLIARGVLYPVLTVTAFLAFSAWFVLNPMVDLALWTLPTSVDRQLGDWSSEAAMASLGPQVKAPAVVQPIQQLVDELTASLPPEPRFEFRAHVVQSEVVNAIALPGGVVVVTTALLKRAPGQEAIAGVLAHEIAHVTERHTMRALLKKIGLWAMLATLFGDVSGLSWIALYQGASLAELGFSRDMEEDADAHGVQLLAEARIDPSGLRDFFAFLEAEEARAGDAESGAGALTRFLSTHPVTRERREAVEALIARHPVAAPRPSPLDWPRYAAGVP